MFRIKVISLFVALFAIFLLSCTPGFPSSQPPSMTLVPGTDIPPQATATSATSTPVPVTIDPSAQTLYQSPALGIQFRYPTAWYLQETAGGTMITSFDPTNPPHILEWTDQTIRMQFGSAVLVTPPDSFDAWVESARQMALTNHLAIYAEEHFLIAGQSAVCLTLVSGSGGIIYQVLTDLNGRYLEIYIEGNCDLAQAVLDSIQPFPAGGLRPPDSDTPTAGICGEAQGDPAPIALGLGPDGIPLAGRCITITTAQRIQLINQSNEPLDILFAGYQIHLPVGGETVLDQPVGQCLALGVHFLPLGPELWVKGDEAGT